MVVDDEVAAIEEVDSTHLTKGTQTFSKKTEAIEEPSKEGGASMQNKVGHALTYNYCGKTDHRKEECRKKKKSESASTSRQLTNYATNSKYDDYGGLFVMRHRANSMSTSNSTNTSNSEDVWFVDFGTSHHMTSHQEWFHDLRTLETINNGLVRF